MTASDGNAVPNEPPTLSRTYNDSASATVDDNEEEPGERETLRRFLFGREKLPLAGETPDPTKLVRYVGDLMYRLLLPEPMQDYLLNNKCSLTITTNDLELP